MATYTVGPSATYANWAALVAAHGTLAAGDIVEYQASTPGGSSTLTGEFINMTSHGAGSSGNPIIIRVRSGDTIILDGNNTVANNIYINADYITVDGFTSKNNTDASVSGGINVRDSGGGTLTGNTVKNCIIEINTATSASASDRRGINATKQNNFLIDSCTITVKAGGSWTTGDIDGMIIGGGNGVTIRNCTITIDNAGSGVGHDDGIQTTDVTNLVIERCLIYRKATDANQGQGIFCEYYNRLNDTTPTDYGYCKVWNNVVYGLGSSFLVNFTVRPQGGAITKDPKVAVTFENNTVDAYNLTGTTVQFAQDTGSEPWGGATAVVKNNIMVIRGTNSEHILGFYAGWDDTSLVIDYNHYYGPSNSVSGTFVGAGAGSWTTWSSWQGLGYDTHGIGTGGSAWHDPLFTAVPDYTLQASSPDIGTGVDLSGDFSNDKNGTTRTAPWDIGAYKYASAAAGFASKLLGKLGFLGKVTIK